MIEIVTPQQRLAVSPTEAAALLGVSRTTMRRWLAAGTVPSTKIGGTRLIRLADLHALMAAAIDGRDFVWNSACQA